MNANAVLITSLSAGLLTFDLHAVLVALLARARVLEPDLDDPLGEAGDLGDPFQIVAVRVRVQLEIGLAIAMREYVKGVHSFSLKA